MSGIRNGLPSAGHEWSIQSATWRDFSQLNQLEKACFPSQDLWPFWDLVAALTLPGLVRLKVVVDDQMVGFIGGERDTALNVGWVTTLGVLPGYRRRGIAAALLNQCEHSLAMPAIRLSVRASNQGAIRLYEAHGYTVIKRWERYYAGGEDALVLEKRD